MNRTDDEQSVQIDNDAADIVKAAVYEREAEAFAMSNRVRAMYNTAARRSHKKPIVPHTVFHSGGTYIADKTPGPNEICNCGSGASINAVAGGNL